MRLGKRDRIALMAGGASLGVFLLLQFVLFPVLEKRSRLQTGLVTRRDGVVQMQQLQQELKVLSSQNSTLSANLEQRDPGFSLFTFLEQNAGASGLKEHIEYMKPSEASGDERIQQSMVEMKLKAIGLGQLVTFLQHVESPEKLVGIKRIAIQENTREEGALDVILQVISVDRLLTEVE